jgi:hypothetical protein
VPVMALAQRAQTLDAFVRNAVSDLLRALGIQRSRTPARRPALAQHEWWLHDLADHLSMSQITLDSWVRRGWADGYLHPQAKLTVVRTPPTRPSPAAAQRALRTYSSSADTTFYANLASRRGAQPTKMPCWFSRPGR